MDEIVRVERASFDYSSVLGLLYWLTYYLIYWLISQGGFLIAEDNERVIGFAIACSLPTAQGELAAMAVDPKYWRMGIGTGLMEEAVAHLKGKGMRRIGVGVMRDNTQAIDFYRRFGFHKRARGFGIYDRMFRVI